MPEYDQNSFSFIPFSNCSGKRIQRKRRAHATWLDIANIAIRSRSYYRVYAANTKIQAEPYLGEFALM